MKSYNLDAATDLARSITTRDITNAGVQMGAVEARFLVDFYYIAQRDRIRSNNQVRTMAGEPSLILEFLGSQAAEREDLIKKALDSYTSASRVGQWLRSIHGVGPVIAAGLLAHIDIRKAPTAGAIWKFAGIDGVTTWNKGEKRPWNTMVKTLAAFKLGESFVKTSNSDKSFYGKLYKARKEMETAKNLAGGYADRAAYELSSKNYSTETATYAALSSGRLSDGHIHARARRYAVKIFLSHLHEVMFRVILGQMPPAPFALAILGHAHKIEIPPTGVNLDFANPIGDDLEVEDNGYGNNHDDGMVPRVVSRSLSNDFNREINKITRAATAPKAAPIVPKVARDGGSVAPDPSPGMPLNEAVKVAKELVKKYEAVARRSTFGAWVLKNHFTDYLDSTNITIQEFKNAERLSDGQAYLLGLLMSGALTLI